LTNALVTFMDLMNRVLKSLLVQVYGIVYR